MLEPWVLLEPFWDSELWEPALRLPAPAQLRRLVLATRQPLRQVRVKLPALEASPPAACRLQAWSTELPALWPSQSWRFPEP